MTELLLASNNAHKTTEFTRLFPGLRILTPRDVGISFDFPEDGATFFANAFGKAEALYKTAGRPVIADDSGLCVDCLGGEPGIYSSRYGSQPSGQLLEAAVRNRYLLERMRGEPERAAHFVCCLVLFLGPDRYSAVQETVSGLITDGPRGTNGFGYDPLFLLPEKGQTMAEIGDAEKDRVSHRGRAAARMRQLIRDID